MSPYVVSKMFIGQLVNPLLLSTVRVRVVYGCPQKDFAPFGNNVTQKSKLEIKIWSLCLKLYKLDDGKMEWLEGG